VYFKLTVAQLRAKLVEHGVKMPTNTRKQGLVDRLKELDNEDTIQDDHLSNNNSVEKCGNDRSHLYENDDSSDDVSHHGYSSDHPDQDLNTTDSLIDQDSFTQAQSVDHESAKKVWIVETREKEGTFNEPEIKLVGVYSNKEDAIKNAKVYFSRMELFEVLYTEEQDKWDENVNRMGRHGGVLCKFDWKDGEGDGEELGIAIRRLDLDRKFHDNVVDEGLCDSFDDDELCWKWDGRSVVCKCDNL